MLESRENAAFLREARRERGAGIPRAQQLERHGLREPFARALREVHHAHAALADLTDQPPWSNPLERCRTRLVIREVPKRTRRVVRAQQRGDFVADRGVAAGVREEAL